MNGSWEGVMTAAATNAAKNACRRYSFSQEWVVIPISTKTAMINGYSKAMPNAVMVRSKKVK